ncbi:hypothetical protein TRIATDRAFT_133358 [Trichoderma atroviride IMI 206040]|uniref:Zn(2)-C6 fungal-type domain-containing protein n=2 Tax=Hypocrea atroviridis TaxID=63577 RepID=G9PBX0_HYPAI|nr:uncharacterized protein TRIATDRAFT_133358 [Trichoderma atroviride IMI 206040]EHK39353.1 hypothetical protein TRIATDRAFT_133358 [Trichoderma atroviride IMI 206040]
MNGAHSRRIACKLCRDRKVRCGGEQPACEKCRRAGEECVYLSTQRPTKADLLQTVEDLQKRLDEAEAHIAKMSASINAVALTDMDRLHQQHSLLSSVPLTNGFIEPLQTAMSQQQSGLSQFRVDGDMMLDSSDNGFNTRSEPFIQGGDSQLWHADMRNWPWSSPVPTRDTDEAARVSEETGAAILDTVAKFSSAVFRSQADACGMATSVADYIAWLRNAPQGGNGMTNKDPIYMALLGTLETRLRELCEVSQSSNRSALRELVTSLEVIAPPGRATAIRLATIEEDLNKEVQERADFFRTRYTPCALLKEQQARDSP